MSKNRGEKIKELEKELSGLERRISDSIETVRAMQEQSKKDSIRVAAIKNQLKSIVPKELVVSDHAVLRYLERKFNISISDIKKEILSQCSGLEQLGSVKAQGFVIRDNVVVTYSPANFDYEKASQESTTV